MVIAVLRARRRRIDGHAYARPGIEKSAHSKAVALSFLARLNDMETVLAEDSIEVLAAKLSDPTMDAVPKDLFLSNRRALLDEIHVAKEFFKSRVQLSVLAATRIRHRA